MPRVRDALGIQLGAALDMLENGVRACPESLWGDRARDPQYWYLVYHTLFWLDLYLSGAVEGFRHVQHHVGQLNLLLRQETRSAPAWVCRGTMTPPAVEPL